MTKKRVAVVTDSVSPNYFFPLFCAHYKNQLPTVDIFVIVPDGQLKDFENVSDATVVKLESVYYNDSIRLEFITKFVQDLLEDYDWVVRADCDEMLIADPRRYSKLDDFLTAQSADYVTALGYEVIASPTEPPLDLSKPILGSQRKCVVALNKMNKTAITRRALRWGRGFHSCDNPPILNGLYLFHLKRADIQSQLDFGHFLAELIKVVLKGDEHVRQYYLTPLDKIRLFHETMHKRRLLTGWDSFEDAEYISKFFAGLTKLPKTGLWECEPGFSHKLVEIPPEFADVI